MRQLILFITIVICSSNSITDILDEVTHKHANNDGTRIHYVSIGQGPLVVMIHGFPDYWYSWRHQMSALKDHYQVIAIDQRGYNKSDQPEGVENYSMPFLVSDVAAVIKDTGASQATIVGHDWGGAVAWQVALNLPQITRNLIILNLPHPNGLAREMRNNLEQRTNSGYAQKFRQGKASDPDILGGGPMTAVRLSQWVQDKEAKQNYIDAFDRSSFSAMLNYYKANYPRLSDSQSDKVVSAPQLNMPVLMFHGLKDRALHSDGLNNTWDWVDQDLTIVTAPTAGHFVQQDAADLVSKTMKSWLLDRR
jgi:pimeloyl-ACP methyl ester carboxylesterase